MIGYVLFFVFALAVSFLISRKATKEWRNASLNAKFRTAEELSDLYQKNSAQLKQASTVKKQAAELKKFRETKF